MSKLNKEEIINAVIDAKDTTYLTHKFHPFSAKFIPQLPNLMIRKFTKEKEIILDPYCGSGTTLVEAKLLGRKSIGVDIHPVGAFMSKVKTTKIPTEELSKVPSLIKEIEQRIDFFLASYFKKRNLLSFISLTTYPRFNYSLPDFHNRDHWFQKHVLHELSIIKTSILEAKISSQLKDLLLVGFSSIVVQTSNQESETRYVAIKKRIPPKRPFLLFKYKVQDMINRIKEFNRRASDCEAIVYHADTRELDFLRNNIADFIMTSPPYPNVYDYYLYHKMRMFWLDMDWERAKINEIGSRLRHSSKRESVETYMQDMTKCFKNFRRILKPERPFVIVVGDSIIRKKLIPGNELVSRLAERTGFDFVDEVDYNQSYASKTFNPAFRNKNKKEHIILLKNIK